MTSRIKIEHETSAAPAGNPLVKHPENIAATSWQRITVAHIQAGQSRAYADSEYVSEICIEGGTLSTQAGYDLPFGTRRREESVKQIARVLVRNFSDRPETGADARLASISCIEQTGTYSKWLVRIVEPYMD